MRRLLVLAAPVAFAFGCPEAEPPPPEGPQDQRVEIPPAPDFGIQVIGPEITIPSGSDHMFCWVPDVTVSEDHLVKSFDAFQGPSGHHLIAMKSVVPRQPGDVFDCTEITQMTTIEPLIVSNSANKEGTGNLLTDEFAVRLPANEQIIMQSHYVNVTTHDILIRDVANITYLPDSEHRIEANYLTLNDGSFSIPATNEHYTHSNECVMDQDYNIAALMGHMHEWGKSIKIEKVDGEGAITKLYEIPEWTAQFRDLAPVTHYETTDPLTLHAGDTLRVTCDWMNDTDEALDFPAEMCVAIMTYYPALPEGFLICGDAT
jgi:hypothetical protein